MSSHWLADSVCPGKCGIASAPLVVVQKRCRLSEQQEIITEALTTAVILSLHSPFLPRPFHPNWLPVRTASCQQVWKLIAELFFVCVCVLKTAGGCAVCQAESKKGGRGSVWVDYWRFASSPHLLLFLLLYSSPSHMSAKAVDGTHPLDEWWGKRLGGSQMFVAAAWHERIWGSISPL